MVRAAAASAATPERQAAAGDLEFSPAAALHQEPVGRRLRPVEGLRAAAAVAVLLHHVWVSTFAGPHPRFDWIFLNLASGVTLFFVISGFLLFRPFAAAALGRGPLPDTGRFFRNRVLRIVPAYWVVLTIVILATLHRLPNRATLPLFYLFLQNYDPRTLFAILPPAWTLAVEAVFYLTLPLFGWLAIRSGPSALPRLLGTAGLASLVLYEVLVWGVPRHSAWYPVLASSFPAQFFQFVPGMALACLHVVDGGGQGIRAAAATRWLPLAGAALLPMAWLSPVVGTALPLEALAYATLAAPVFLGQVGGAGRLLASPPAVAVGIVSYSLYLWHWPVIGFLGRLHLWRPETLAWNLALTLLVSIAASAASYLIVERPFMRLRLTWTRTSTEVVVVSKAAAATP